MTQIQIHWASNMTWAIQWIEELQEPFRLKWITNSPHYSKIRCLRKTTNYPYHICPKTLTQKSNRSAVPQKRAAVTLTWGSPTLPHPPTEKTEMTADLQPSSKRRRISGGKKWIIWSTGLTATFRVKRSNRAAIWNPQRRSYERLEKAFWMVSTTSSRIYHSHSVAEFRMTNWLPHNFWINCNPERKGLGMSSVFSERQKKEKYT